LPAFQGSTCAPPMTVPSGGSEAEDRAGREMVYHASTGQPMVADEVSRRRRATYRRRYTTTVFGGAPAADGATASATGEVTAWEDDELDRDEDENEDED